MLGYHRCILSQETGDTPMLAERPIPVIEAEISYDSKTAIHSCSLLGQADPNASLTASRPSPTSASSSELQDDPLHRVQCLPSHEYTRSLRLALSPCNKSKAELFTHDIEWSPLYFTVDATYVLPKYSEEYELNATDCRTCNKQQCPSRYPNACQQTHKQCV